MNVDCREDCDRNQIVDCNSIDNKINAVSRIAFRIDDDLDGCFASRIGIRCIVWFLGAVEACCECEHASSANGFVSDYFIDLSANFTARELGSVNVEVKIACVGSSYEFSVVGNVCIPDSNSEAFLDDRNSGDRDTGNAVWILIEIKTIDDAKKYSAILTPRIVKTASLPTLSLLCE